MRRDAESNTESDRWGRSMSSRSDNSRDMFTILALMFYHYKDLQSVENILLFGLQTGKITGQDPGNNGAFEKGPYLHSRSYFKDGNKSSEPYWIKTRWQLGRSRPGKDEVLWSGRPEFDSFRAFYLILWKYLGGKHPLVMKEYATTKNIYNENNIDFFENTANKIPVRGFARHRVANRIFLMHLIGENSSYAKTNLKYLISKEPHNAVFQAIYFRITGDLEARKKAVNILMDKKYFPTKTLPSGKLYSTEYLFQRDEYLTDSSDNHLRDNRAQLKISADWLPSEGTQVQYHSGTDFLWAACLLSNTCIR